MRIFLVSLPLMLVACGVSDSTKLIDLSSDDATKVCEEYEPREVTCGEGEFEFTLTFAGDCDNTDVGDAPATCEATVGDWRDCFDAIYALSDEEICTSEDFPADCDALFSDACVGAE